MCVCVGGGEVMRVHETEGRAVCGVDAGGERGGG